MQRWMLALAGLLACALIAPRATAQAVPAGYPAGYARTIADARSEATLRIWSATDRERVTDLLDAFRRTYPGIRIDYRQIGANEINTHFLADYHAGRAAADVLWSPAMDLQIKLTNDGYAQTYVSPERLSIAPWASWKNQAWGTTAEPVVIVYNKRLISPNDIPRSRAALLALLEQKPQLLRGRIATYDPRASAAGFLYVMQDKQATRDVWRLLGAMGKARVRLFPTSDAIINDVVSGRSAIGYNVIGSYAIDELAQNPDLGIIFPLDYTLVMSRIAIIPANAPHPNAARLFIDFLLSAAGQRQLARHGMSSVRGDVAVPAALRNTSGPMRAIRVGPALLVHQDRLTRGRFLTQWDRAMATR